MQEHADARIKLQQCQEDQINMVKMLQDALDIERLVRQHDVEIREFRDDHAKLKASVESLKNPLDILVKDIAEIKITNAAMSPILQNYTFIQKWSVRVSYTITACTMLYILFGSNAIKLIGMILAAM